MKIKYISLCAILISITTSTWASYFMAGVDEIDDACKRRSVYSCTIAHVWASSQGSGNKCFLAADLQLETNVCTVKCKNIKTQKRCALENRNCDWNEAKNQCESKLGRQVHKPY